MEAKIRNFQEIPFFMDRIRRWIPCYESLNKVNINQEKNTYLSIVKVEGVIVVEVGLDAVEVEQHIIKLFEQEKARGHALPPGDGVAFGRRPAHQLEVLLGHLQVLPLGRTGGKGGEE